MTIKRICVSSMNEEEIFAHLKAGRVVARDDDDGTYKLVNGLVCRYEGDTITDIGYTLDLEDAALYIDIEEPFKINGTGLYKTRDGRRALVSFISNDKDLVFPAYGIVEGDSSRDSWRLDGHALNDKTSVDDLVEKVKGV